MHMNRYLAYADLFPGSPLNLIFLFFLLNGHSARQFVLKEILDTKLHSAARSLQYGLVVRYFVKYKKF